MTLPTSSQVIGIANTLLQQAGVCRSVHGIEQCGSILFGQLYEALTGSTPPTRGENEVERCQAVVDAFSQQLSPHISLDHIRGRDLALRDPLTIIHLLDIFSALFQFPTGKKSSGPAAASSRQHTSNIASDEGHAPGHTPHMSSSCSTDTTADLLRPVPLPLLRHPHTSHSPPLTITSLTCSTITDDTSQPDQGADPGKIVPPAGPQQDPTLLTPPPSPKKQLLKSPLHHSTPRAQGTRARVFPDHAPSRQPPPPTTSMTSHPIMHHLTTVTRPSPCVHTVPAVTDSSDVAVGEEKEDNDPHVIPATQTPRLDVENSKLYPECGNGNETLVGEQQTLVPHTSTVATQTTRQDNETSTLDPDSEHGNETPERKQRTTGPPDTTPPHKIQSHSVKFQPSVLGGPSPREGKGEEREEVRREVLSSLYQRYLKELRTTGPHSAERRRNVKTRPTKPHRRKAVSRPPPPSPHRQHCPVEEGERGKVMPPRVGVTSDLFPVVEAALPVCPVTTETVHHLWRKQLHQITTSTKLPPSHPTRVDQAVEAVKRKHTALLEAMRKEIDHTRRLRVQQETRAQQRAVKSQLRAKRQATARARRYFRDYELSLKSKLQQKRTNQEMVFRRVFEDGLAILRERERELRRLEREKRDNERERQRQQLQAMEQYYNDQFTMLAESLARQRGRVAVKEKAQNKLTEELCVELRKKLEREVEQLQDCLDREEDVTHFRELDAQQLKLALLTLSH